MKNFYKVSALSLLLLITLFHHAEARSTFRMIASSDTDTYKEGETVTFYIQGKESDRTFATREEGFHVQAELRRSGLSPDTGGVGFNADYDSNGNRWVLNFPAPGMGRYDVELVLYCSQDQALCATNYEEGIQKVLTRSFTVAQKTTIQKSGYVTYDIASDQEPTITQRKDGSLVVSYNSVNQKGQNGIFRTYSKDNGLTWSKPKYFSNSWSNIDSLAIDNSFFLFQTSSTHDGNEGLSVRDESGVEHLLPFTRPNDQVGSLLKAQNGYYYLSYSTLNPTNVFIVKTKDFKKWSEPVQLSFGSGFEFDSSLTQAKGGTFYLAFNNYTEQGVTILSSKNGSSWKRETTVLSRTDAQSGITSIVINGTPVVFFAHDGSTYFFYKTSDGWTMPQLALSGTPFGIDAYLKSDGSVIAVYTVENNNQRDLKITTLENLGIPKQ